MATLSTNKFCLFAAAQGNTEPNAVKCFLQSSSVGQSPAQQSLRQVLEWPLPGTMPALPFPAPAKAACFWVTLRSQQGDWGQIIQVKEINYLLGILFPALKEQKALHMDLEY